MGSFILKPHDAVGEFLAAGQRQWVGIALHVGKSIERGDAAFATVDARRKENRILVNQTLLDERSVDYATAKHRKPLHAKLRGDEFHCLLDVDGLLARADVAYLL